MLGPTKAVRGSGRPGRRASRRAVAERLEPRVVPAQVTWVRLGDGAWFDPDAWDRPDLPGAQPGVPDLDDTAVLDGHTVTIGAGEIVARGSGSIEGGGQVVNLGTLVLTSAAHLPTTVLRSPIVNSGRITQAAPVILDGTCTITNTATGTYDLAGDHAIGSISTIFFGEIRNEGFLAKSVGGGTADWSVRVTNLATLRVDEGAGELHLERGLTALDGSTLDVAPGASVRLTHDFQTGVPFTPAGTVHGTGGGSVAVESCAIRTSLGPATLDFAPGMLSLGHIFVYAEGPLTNAASSTVVGQPVVLGSWINAGTIDVAAGAAVRLHNGATLENQAGATLTLADGAWIGPYNVGGAPMQFVNAGTLVKGPGPGHAEIQVDHLDTGTIRIEGGSLAETAVLTSTGTFFDVIADGSIAILGTFRPAGTLTGIGGGDITIAANVEVRSPATFSFPDRMLFWQGGFTFCYDMLTNAGHLVVSGSPVLLGVMANEGVLTVDQGATLRIHNGSALENRAGGSLVLSGTGSIGNYNVGGAPFRLENAGLIRKEGAGASSSIGVDLNSTGTVEAASGTLSLDGAVAQVSGSTLTGGTWIARAGSTLAIPWASPFTTSGARLVLDGPGSTLFDLSSLQEIVAGGALELLGGRSLATTAGLANGGRIVLGAGSVLDLAGAYTQQAAGTMAVALGGSPGSGAFGRIVASGDASLDGALAVTLADGFVPGAGSTYPVVTGSARLGAFASTSLPTAPGLVFAAQATAAGVDVTVAAANAAPVLDPLPDVTVDEGTALDLRPAARDVPGQALTFTLAAGAPSWLSIDPATGRITGSPPDGPSSMDVTVRVTDDAAEPLLATRTFRITVANVAPAVAVGAPIAASRRVAWERVVTTTDPGAADGCTCAVDYGEGDGWQPVAESSAHAFTLRHAYAATGDYTVRVRVTDRDGGARIESLPAHVVAAPPRVLAVRRVGNRRGTTALEIDLTEPLNAKRARVVGNYLVLGAGRDGVLGSRDDRAVAIQAATYAAGPMRVRLKLSAAVPASQALRLSARGTSARRHLVDLLNRLLDGDADGTAGGDFTAVV